jgi:hypothetical protein
LFALVLDVTDQIEEHSKPVTWNTQVRTRDT